MEQGTGISLQLIRKPDRDWNKNYARPRPVEEVCYNSLENPIGIETDPALVEPLKKHRYNSLENPIGIETAAGLCGATMPPTVTTH